MTATENLNNNPTASKSEGGSGGGGGGSVLANTISVVATKEVSATPKLLPNGHDSADFIVPKVGNDVRAADVKEGPQQQALEVRKPGDRRASSPFQNGRTELLIGAEDNKFKTTAIVESNNNKLGVEGESR